MTRGSLGEYFELADYNVDLFTTREKDKNVTSVLFLIVGGRSVERAFADNLITYRLVNVHDCLDRGIQVVLTGLHKVVQVHGEGPPLCRNDCRANITAHKVLLKKVNVECGRGNDKTQVRAAL